MKKGFTLAETLITLAIIGVVAALTIPVLVGKYQKHQLYTQFMKVYNTLSTAYSLSIAENGEPDSWTWDNNDKEGSAQKYLGNYLKIANNCTGNAINCGYESSEEETSMLNSASHDTELAPMIEGGTPGFVLQDGSLVMIAGSVSNSGFSAEIYVDVNGAKKGPDKFGRDVYGFYLRKIQSGDYAFYPIGVYNDDGETNTLNDIINGEEMYSNCSTAIESSGYGCGARLLLEGKMNY